MNVRGTVLLRQCKWVKNTGMSTFRVEKFNQPSQYAVFFPSANLILLNKQKENQAKCRPSKTPTIIAIYI